MGELRSKKEPTINSAVNKCFVLVVVVSVVVDFGFLCVNLLSVRSIVNCKLS